MHELTPEQVEAINDALAAGSKIQAIKLYREATGQGLKESKDFIEALIPGLIAEDPVRFARLANGGGSGCSTKAGVLMLLAGGGVWLWQYWF